MKSGYSYKYDVDRRDARGKHTRNAGWEPGGSHWVVCDICGCDIRNYDARLRWDNMLCCPDDWEPRHEQDFVRGKADSIAPKGYVRPPQEDVFREITLADQEAFIPLTTFGEDILGAVDDETGADGEAQESANFTIYPADLALAGLSSAVVDVNAEHHAEGASSPFFSYDLEHKGFYYINSLMITEGSISEDGSETIDNDVQELYVSDYIYTGTGGSGRVTELIIDLGSYSDPWSLVTINGITYTFGEFTNTGGTRYTRAISVEDFDAMFPTEAIHSVAFASGVEGEGIGYSEPLGVGTISNNFNWSGTMPGVSSATLYEASYLDDTRTLTVKLEIPTAQIAAVVQTSLPSFSVANNAGAYGIYFTYSGNAADTFSKTTVVGDSTIAIWTFDLEALSNEIEWDEVFTPYSHTAVRFVGFQAFDEYTFPLILNDATNLPSDLPVPLT